MNGAVRRQKTKQARLSRGQGAPPRNRKWTWGDLTVGIPGAPLAHRNTRGSVDGSGSAGSSRNSTGIVRAGIGSGQTGISKTAAEGYARHDIRHTNDIPLTLVLLSVGGSL